MFHLERILCDYLWSSWKTISQRTASNFLSVMDFNWTVKKRKKEKKPIAWVPIWSICKEKNVENLEVFNLFAFNLQILIFWKAFSENVQWARTLKIVKDLSAGWCQKTKKIFVKKDLVKIPSKNSSNQFTIKTKFEKHFLVSLHKAVLLLYSRLLCDFYAFLYLKIAKLGHILQKSNIDYI